MSIDRIYIQSRVLGSEVVGHLIHSQFSFAHVRTAPSIFADQRTGLYEEVKLFYNEYSFSTKLMDAMFTAWEDLSRSNPVVRLSGPLESFRNLFEKSGKIALRCEKFYYWEQGDPGSVTELADPVLIFICTPDMKLHNQLEIQVIGFTNATDYLYPILTDMWDTTKHGWRSLGSPPFLSHSKSFIFILYGTLL